MGSPAITAVLKHFSVKVQQVKKCLTNTCRYDFLAGLNVLREGNITVLLRLLEDLVNISREVYVDAKERLDAFRSDHC